MAIDMANYTSTYTGPQIDTATAKALGLGYGECTGSTATLAVTLDNNKFILTTGTPVCIKFTNAIVANATLNINSTGAKALKYNGAAITAGTVPAGQTVFIMYDGTAYNIIANMASISVAGTKKTDLSISVTDSALKIQ